MTGQEYLKRIKKIDTQIKNKNVERQQLRALEVSTEEVIKELGELQRERRAIIANIEKLNEAEYDILHGRYVQGKALKAIAVERGESYSLITTVHGTALRNLEDIINNNNLK